MQRNSNPLPWRPAGVSDTLDSSESFAGAMGLLTNLIPDPSTKGLWHCRPAAVPKPGFTPAGDISVERVFGDFVYGMRASGVFAGHDEPFVFNLLTNTFVTLTGQTANNTPISPQPVGAWVPPQIEAIGSKVCVVHQGFSGAFGNYFGYFDITDPLHPVWHGANCSGANFGSFLVAPTGIAQFSNRAYFLHNLQAQPAVIFSDVLSPTTNSAGGVVPVLTFGDTQKLTAIAGLPLSTTQGGIIQSLMVFKGVTNIFQVTGDASGIPEQLKINSLNVPTGTLAPRSVCTTPLGLAFMSLDGLRFIDFGARVSDTVGDDGQGITVPFMFVKEPSRMAAGSNDTVVRITTQNTKVPGDPYQEYWYNYSHKNWSGPHTSACTCYSPFQNTFITVLQTQTDTLFQSDYEQSNTSTFTEDDLPLTWGYASSFLPDTDKMTLNAMTETTLGVALGPSQIISVSALQEDEIKLDTTTIVNPIGNVPLWGVAIWGQFNWGGISTALSPKQVNWHVPICFAKLLILVVGRSNSTVKLGTLHLRYQILRTYMDEGAVIPSQALRAPGLFILDQSQLDGSDVLGSP